MKKILLFAVLIATSGQLAAQFQVNPQVGVTMQDLTGEDEGIEYRAAVGFQLGVDFRVGDRVYFQPGFHMARSATTIKFTQPDTTIIEGDVVRTTVKLKALVGYNIVDGTAFKLRLNGGPTYDVLLSVDNKDDDIEFNKDDYNAGSFNMDIGLGADFAILSAETGVSYGLSNAYKETDELSSEARYFTWYFTLGIVLGGGGGE